MKKVLFIHHGGVAGGAPLSMLYTMKGMRQKGFQPIAALRNPSKELHALYNTEDFETFEMKWMPKFITWAGNEGKRYNPFTWIQVAEAGIKWDNAKKNLIEFIREHSIDIVHLNSVGLSNPASILIKENIPLVWHVREMAPKSKGKRYQFIKKKLLSTPNIIFLSKAEQKGWTGGNSHGTVISNFIDFNQFDFKIDQNAIAKDLGIRDNQKVLLYVGGMKSFKGIVPLLKALAIVKKKWGSDFICLMPDTHVANLAKATRFENEVLNIIDKNCLNDNCKLMAFNPKIVPLFAICDMLVFPATEPHFSRPIVEASGMKKPVIASDLMCIDELVIPNETGFLVPAKDEKALANKIIQLFESPDLCMKMGENGYQFVLDNFEFNMQMEKVHEVYLEAVSTKNLQLTTEK